jgi:hypothetical protein
VLPYYIPVGAELGTIGIAFVAAYAGVKAYGKEKAAYFLAGSVLWTSIIDVEYHDLWPLLLAGFLAAPLLLKYLSSL